MNYSFVVFGECHTTWHFRTALS